MRLVVAALLVAAFLSASVAPGVNPCRNILSDAEWINLQTDAEINYTKGFTMARDALVAAYNAVLSKEAGVRDLPSASKTTCVTTNRSEMTSAGVKPSQPSQVVRSALFSDQHSLATPNSAIESLKCCATSLTTLFTTEKSYVFVDIIQEYIRRCKMADDLRSAFYQGNSYFEVPDISSRPAKAQVLKKRKISHASSTTTVSNSKSNYTDANSSASELHDKGKDIELRDLPRFKRLQNTSNASNQNLAPQKQSINIQSASVSNPAVQSTAGHADTPALINHAKTPNQSSNKNQICRNSRRTRSTGLQAASVDDQSPIIPIVAQKGRRRGTLWSKRNTTLAKILKKKAMQQPYRTRKTGDVSFGRSSNMSTYRTSRSAMTNQRKSVSRNDSSYTVREQPNAQTRRPYIRSNRASQPLPATVNQIDDRTCNNGISIDRVIPFAWRFENHAEYTHAALQYGIDDIAIDLLLDLEACILANDIRGVAGITDVVRNHPDVCVEERLQSVQTRFFMAEHIPTLLLLHQTVPTVKVHTKLALLTICPKQLAKHAFAKHFKLEAIYNRIMVAIRSFNRKFEIQQQLNKAPTANLIKIFDTTADTKHQNNGSEMSSSMRLANDQRLPGELTWTDTTQMHCSKSTTGKLVPLGTKLFQTLLNDGRDNSINH